MAEQKDGSQSPPIPHSRSNSVPVMSCGVGFNDTELQGQSARLRSSIDTTSSQTLGSSKCQAKTRKLSSGGLLRNQSKKRRAKNRLEKSRSVDSAESINSSRKSSTASNQSYEGDSEGNLFDSRKHGSIIMDNLDENHSNKIDSKEDFHNNKREEQTTSHSFVCTRERSTNDEQQHKSTALIQKKKRSNSDYVDMDDSGQNSIISQELVQLQDTLYTFEGESKSPSRRRSLPVELSKYHVDLNNDYQRGHEHRQTRFPSNHAGDSKVCEDNCSENLHRRSSLPTSLSQMTNNYCETQNNQGFTIGEPSEALGVNVATHQSTMVKVISSLEDSRDNKGTLNQSHAIKEDEQLPRQPLENTPDSSSTVCGSLNKINRSRSVSGMAGNHYEIMSNSARIRSLSLPRNFRYRERHVENLAVGNQPMLCTKDRKVPVVQEKWDKQIAPDLSNYKREKPKRQRRTKSLPAILVLDEIPEEREEERIASAAQSVENITRRHVNKAFFELLKRISKNQLQSKCKQIRRTHSLTTIPEKLYEESDQQFSVDSIKEQEHQRKSNDMKEENNDMKEENNDMKEENNDMKEEEEHEYEEPHPQHENETTHGIDEHDVTHEQHEDESTHVRQEHDAHEQHEDESTHVRQEHVTHEQHEDESTHVRQEHDAHEQHEDESTHVRQEHDVTHEQHEDESTHIRQEHEGSVEQSEVTLEKQDEAMHEQRELDETHEVTREQYEDETNSDDKEQIGHEDTQKHETTHEQCEDEVTHEQHEHETTHEQPGHETTHERHEHEATNDQPGHETTHERHEHEATHEQYEDETNNEDKEHKTTHEQPGHETTEERREQYEDETNGNGEEEQCEHEAPHKQEVSHERPEHESPHEVHELYKDERKFEQQDEKEQEEEMINELRQHEDKLQLERCDDKHKRESESELEEQGNRQNTKLCEQTFLPESAEQNEPVSKNDEERQEENPTLSDDDEEILDCNGLLETQDEQTSVHKAEEGMDVEIPNIILTQDDVVECEQTQVQTQTSTDEEAQGTTDSEDFHTDILEHVQPLELTALPDARKPQRPRVKCMARIPEEIPDFEDEEDYQFKREGSLRRGIPRSNKGSVRKKFLPPGNKVKRVTWSDTNDVIEAHCHDDVDACPDVSTPNEQEFGEHAQNVEEEATAIQDEKESKFDVLLRSAMNSYLEPDFSQSTSPIHRAVARGCVDTLVTLINDGGDVNANDENRRPPLHVAMLTNNVDCAAILLEAGADLQQYTDALVTEYYTLKHRTQLQYFT